VVFQNSHVFAIKTNLCCHCHVVEMAVSDGSPTPQMVGNAFVEQYYSILHQEPDQVHRFYHESSVLSRPEEDGSMTMVTTTVVSTSDGVLVIARACGVM